MEISYVGNGNSIRSQGFRCVRCGALVARNRCAYARPRRCAVSSCDDIRHERGPCRTLRASSHRRTRTRLSPETNQHEPTRTVNRRSASSRPFCRFQRSFSRLRAKGTTVGRETLRGTDMILTTHGNRRVLCTSVKITSGSIREAADRAIPARSEPFVV